MFNILGPAVGSYLYSLGGFTLPFFTFGMLTMVLSLGLVVLMPKIKETKKNLDILNPPKNLTFSTMLKVNFIEVLFKSDLILSKLEVILL